MPSSDEDSQDHHHHGDDKKSSRHHHHRHHHHHDKKSGDDEKKERHHRKKLSSRTKDSEDATIKDDKKPRPIKKKPSRSKSNSSGKADITNHPSLAKLSLDDNKKVKKPTNRKPKGKGLGLGGLDAKLKNVGGLQRQDFGRTEDDDDTFCGMGTVGETEVGANKHIQNTGRPNTTNNNTVPKKNPMLATAGAGAGGKGGARGLGGLGGGGGGLGGMGMYNNRRDDDSEDEEEEPDLFADANNPFKQFRK